MKLQEALDEEAILEEQMLALMHRFADRFMDRRVEISNLMVLHDHPLIDYGKFALGCMTGAGMKKCVELKGVRDELLRSMKEKRQNTYNDHGLLISTTCNVCYGLLYQLTPLAYQLFIFSAIIQCCVADLIKFFTFPKDHHRLRHD
nr:hypothetical protein [Tanacetum cinerariifolium]